MSGAHAAEAPALHAALEALALGVTRDIDELAGDEVRSAVMVEPTEQDRIVGDAEFGDLHLQRHFSLGEMLTLRLGNVLLLGNARTELERDVTVTLGGADRDHLAIFQRQDGNRHVPSVLLEQAGHPHLLGDHAGTHDPYSIQRPCGTIPRGVFNPNVERAPSGLSAPRGAGSETGDACPAIAGGIPVSSPSPKRGRSIKPPRPAPGLTANRLTPA